MQLWGCQVYNQTGLDTITDMQEVNERDLRELYRAPKDSHKGQNGKLLVIGGSKLFHAAAFWSATVASRIVDLVHFSSPAMENNELMRKKAKEKFWEGIVVPWEKVEEYIEEDDCVLIGPGMPRDEGLQKGERPTGEVVDGLLKLHGNKKWVIDGGALQEVSLDKIPQTTILTPHPGELDGLLVRLKIDASDWESKARAVSERLGCAVLAKGKEDVVCGEGECRMVQGGNEGMTKGGTGDVLAGIVAALYCKNDAMLSALAGSLINKRAGDEVYKSVGPYFNAQDLLGEVPRVMKDLLRY